MKLLVDMNLAPRWVDWLVQSGQSAAHWSSIGDRAAPDSSIMEYARANDMVVLTHDLDFGAILAASGGEKPSVIQIRADNNSPEVVGAQVLAALTQLAAELEAGALVSVDPGRSRVRLLPLPHSSNQRP